MTKLSLSRAWGLGYFKWVVEVLQGGCDFSEVGLAFFQEESIKAQYKNVSLRDRYITLSIFFT